VRRSGPLWRRPELARFALTHSAHRPTTTPDLPHCARACGISRPSTPFPKRVVNSDEFAGYLIFNGIRAVSSTAGVTCTAMSVFFDYVNAMELKDFGGSSKLLDAPCSGRLLRPGLRLSP